MPGGTEASLVGAGFLLGLLLGSFLNVCISRLPLGESVAAPSSKCPVCGEKLRPADLVPLVSYLILKGKCRYCAAAISARYPLVELVSGLLVAGLFWLYPVGMALWFTIPILLSLSAAVSDLETGLIPNWLVLPPMVAGVALHPLIPWGGTWEGALGAVLGGGVLFLVALASKGGMGGGDVKLMAALGAWLGLADTLVVLVVSFIVGGLAGILLLAFKIKGRKDAVPFGPFISAALLLTVYAREPMLSQYWELLQRLGLY